MVFTLFVCLLAGLRKIYSTDFHKIRLKGGTHELRRNPLHFDGNPDHVTLGLGFGLGFGQDYGHG